MQEVYQRRYKKFQDISASIGGIINLIIVIVKLIYKLFEKYVLINDILINLKVKCNDIVRNVYKTSFKDLNINKECEYNVKKNNFFDNSSKQKIIENLELKKIENINSLNKTNNNKHKFNLSFSKIVRLSSLNYNKFKKISYFDILFNTFNCNKKNNDLINKLDNFRKNIISEEGLFTTYYILMTLINKNNIEINE